MDAEGYPEEHELKYIRDFDPEMHPLVLVEYIRERWQNADVGYFELKKLRSVKVNLTGAPRPRQIMQDRWDLYLGTSGWSGNESIIEALRDSAFWWMYWYQHNRGGHYRFEIKRLRID